MDNLFRDDHCAYAGGNATGGNAENEEDEEDLVVFDRRDDFLASLRGQLRLDPLSGDKDGDKSVITHTTSSASDSARGFHPTIRPLAAVADHERTEKPHASVNCSKQEGAHTAESHSSLQKQKPQQQQQQLFNTLRSPSISSLFTASPPTTIGAGTVASSIVTMDAVVHVPRALHSSAVRRTMLDVLLVQKRKEAAARDAGQRRMQSAREAPPPELFDKQQQKDNGDAHKLSRDDIAGALERVMAIADGRLSTKPSAAASMQANASPANETANSMPVDASRRLRHLLPGHLSKLGREREVALAIERRKHEAAEKAMALDISDFSSSDSSRSDSCSRMGNGCRQGSHNDDGHEEAEGRLLAVMKPVHSRGVQRRGKEEEAALSLLQFDEIEKESESGVKGKATEQQQQRSVADLFNATEERVWHPSTRNGTHPSVSYSHTTKTTRASDLIDSGMDVYEANERKHTAAAAAVALTVSNRLIHRLIDTDPFDTHAAPGVAGTTTHSSASSPCSSLAASDADSNDLSHNTRPSGTKKSTKKLTELLNEQLTDDAVLVAHGQRERDREASARAQQMQWLNHLRSLRDLRERQRNMLPPSHHADKCSFMTDGKGYGGNSGGEVESLLDGLGIVGKPIGLCITSIVNAIPRRSGDEGVVDFLLNPTVAFAADSRGRLGSFTSPLSQPAGHALLGQSISNESAMAVAVIPRLLTNPRQLSFTTSAGGSSFSAASRHSLRSPTAVRLVEYLREQFDSWLLNGQAILRELAQQQGAGAEASARAVVAAAAATTDTASADPTNVHGDRAHPLAHTPPGNANSRDGSSHHPRRHSSANAILQSVLSAARESDEELRTEGEGATSVISHQRGGVPQVAAGAAPSPGTTTCMDSVTTAPTRAVTAEPTAPFVSLEGSGVHMKLRVAFADGAFGLRRVVGDLEWLSARARRRCGADFTGELAVAAGLTATTSASFLPDGLFYHRPDPRTFAARRWTFILPDHVFRALPLTIGHCLYLGEPFFVLPDARTAVASYVVTTDLLIHRAMRACEAVLRGIVAAPAVTTGAGRRAVAEMATAAAGSTVSAHTADRLATTTDASTVVDANRRSNIPSVHAPAIPSCSSNDNFHLHAMKSDGENSNSSRNTERDGTSRSQSDAPSLSQSAAKTPFHNKLYDPLAYPGMTTVGQGCQPQAGAGCSFMDSVGVYPQLQERQQQQQNESLWQSMVMNRNPPQVSQGVRQLFGRRADSERSTTSSQRRQPMQQQQLMWDEQDPVGSGFMRGPGPGWHLPLDVLHVLVAASAASTVSNNSSMLAHGAQRDNHHGQSSMQNMWSVKDESSSATIIPTAVIMGAIDTRGSTASAAPAYTAAATVEVTTSGNRMNASSSVVEYTISTPEETPAECSRQGPRPESPSSCATSSTASSLPSPSNEFYAG